MDSIDSHSETPNQVAPELTLPSTKNPNQTRRNRIINAALAVIGGLTFQGAVNQSASQADIVKAIRPFHVITADLSTPTKTPSPTVQVTASPTQQSMDDILKATATALNQENRQSSFQPEGKFTQEVFNEVQQATFKIAVVGMVTDDKGNKGMEYLPATAWLARINSDKNQYDLVTNAHVLGYGKIEIQNVYALRPGIDQIPVSLGPGSCQVVTSQNYDVGILSCHLSQDQVSQMSTPLVPLIFMDGDKPNQDEKLLTVGFPGDFNISNSTDLKAKTLGEVITVDGTTQNMGHEVSMARGISSHGGSGSPTTKLFDDVQVVIGMVYAGEERGDQLMVTPLDVQILLDQLDGQNLKSFQ